MQHCSPVVPLGSFLTCELYFALMNCMYNVKLVWLILAFIFLVILLFAVYLSPL